MSKKNPHTKLNPPEWAQNAIWYQILVERFYNGDESNDPTPNNLQGAWPHNYDENWKITPWTQDWYKDSPKNGDKESINHWYNLVQSRRYGGDLKGIIDKLDYLQNLGINAIYLNPVNDSPSLHKYDARNYHHIDIHFGPDPEGDKIIMKSENPNDPATWKWTSADLLFLELVKKVHERGMHIIVDFSWNHTGSEFWAWKDVVKFGVYSPYADWYEINMFRHPNEGDHEVHFTAWSGVKEMPQLRKKKFTLHQKGFPYHGDMQKGIKQHIFDVTQRWLRPIGFSSEYGIDGFRLDVADEIGLEFWKDYRKWVKSLNPQAFLVGEIWWEEWPDKMMDPRPYLRGDAFDSVMFYQPYKFTRAFFAKTEEYQGAEVFGNQLKYAIRNFTDPIIKNLMMMSASHDSPRLLTSFFNKNKYKFQAKSMDNLYYKTSKPDPETYDRVRLFLAFQFTMPGAPQIWAGDEMGMWGSDDPDSRKPLWWPEFKFEDETSNPFEPITERHTIPVGFDQSQFLYYKKLIDFRNNHPILVHGALKFVSFHLDLVSFKRFDDEQMLYLFFNNSNEKMWIENVTISGFDLWNRKNFEADGRFEMQPLSFLIIQTKTINNE